MLERLNQELKRRPHVVRIFPNAESGFAAGPGAGRRDARELAGSDPLSYLNMNHLKEHKKEALRALAA